MESVGKGYALWLTPEEPMFSFLEGAISRLSQEYAIPRFDPHVTLVSGIMAPEEEVLANTALLAGALKPFRLELGNVGYFDEYFRCLFVEVVPEDSLIKANRTAREAFRLQMQPPYMPHLSLVYGKLQIETKRVIAASFALLSGKALEIHHLTLYRVTGAPHEWKYIEKFELT